MAEAQTVTPTRRRTRTGCLTFRGRRRKCDENIPVCRKYQEENVECRYGVRVTFVGANGRRTRYGANAQPATLVSTYEQTQWESYQPSTPAVNPARAQAHTTSDGGTSIADKQHQYEAQIAVNVPSKFSHNHSCKVRGCAAAGSRSVRVIQQPCQSGSEPAHVGLTKQAIYMTVIIDLLGRPLDPISV